MRSVLLFVVAMGINSIINRIRSIIIYSGSNSSYDKT